MQKIEVEIRNETGLHARPASIFVKQAQKFQSTITVRLNDRTINAKSILQVLALGADQGTMIEICADGQDEQQAIDTLADILYSSFE
jgi:phosphotransferase system HPr (HPr) family protein